MTELKDQKLWVENRLVGIYHEMKESLGFSLRRTAWHSSSNGDEFCIYDPIACPFHKLDRSIFELLGARRGATMVSVAVGGTSMADSDTTSDEGRVVRKRTRSLRELKQRGECSNDGGHGLWEWQSRSPSPAIRPGGAPARPSQATNGSGKNDSSRHIRVGFASGAARLERSRGRDSRGEWYQ